MVHGDEDQPNNTRTNTWVWRWGYAKNQTHTTIDLGKYIW